MRREIERIKVKFLLIDRCFYAIINEDKGWVKEDSCFGSVVFEGPSERVITAGPFNWYIF